jgi:hypothetical protein
MALDNNDEAFNYSQRRIPIFFGETIDYEENI